MKAALETLAGGFDRNLCYVFGCAATGEGALIDAGIGLDEVFAAFDRARLRPSTLLVTHAHGDHLSEALEFVRRTGARVHAFDPRVRARLSGAPFRRLSDGDEIQVGRRRVLALHTPGHSPDSMCFLAADLLFSGDTLFVGRTGRTVSAESSVEDLYRSVERLKALPDETRVLPGHDYGHTPASTIGREKAENPFLRARGEEEFVKVMEDYERSRRRGA